MKSPKEARSDSLHSDLSYRPCENRGWQKSPESDTSWTEEVCLNALAYLDSGSDSEECKPRLSDGRQQDSTQDESSFMSAADSEPMKSESLCRSSFPFVPQPGQVFHPNGSFVTSYSEFGFQPSFVPSFSEMAVEFRPSVIAKKELAKGEQDVLDRLRTLCFDQAGCRMLQKKLEDVRPGESAFVSSLVSGMLPFFAKVSNNQFGNYLCQRVIEVCSPDELSAVTFAVLSSLYDMALNTHGTRVVQTLVEAAADAWLCNGDLHTELRDMIKVFEYDTRTLCMDNNGNHVIQVFLNKFKSSEEPQDADLLGTDMYPQFTDFVFRACMASPVEIGRHK